MYPQQGKRGDGVRSVLGQKVLAFPRDGSGLSPSASQTFALLFAQALFKGEASFSCGRDVVFFFCIFFFCIVLCSPY